MKITYNWIKEFLDVRISPEALADRLTMAGLSVAGLDKDKDDWVYDIEVTSNRPDWLSVRGIVREVAAITGARMKKTVDSPQSKVHGKNKTDHGPSTMDHGQFSIRIDDPMACGLYHGALIANVAIGPSPAWLSARLASVGMRPVNNVVDITNYCMLTYGQPLHAFDIDKVGGRSIVVRRARAGEKLVLIDGTEKALAPEVLLIADAARPIAVAGIMGGRDTEVGADTKDILLESAYFDPVIVRRGARKIGVASDASYRFERGVDIATVKVALEAAARMIGDVCGGTHVGSKVAGTLKPPRARKIIFSLAESCDVLGLAISAAKAKEALTHLGFGVKAGKKNAFEVTVPAVRRDVKIKEDITEEIARSFGYDKIPLTSPQIKPFVLRESKIQRVEPLVREMLVNSGLKEVVTYSLTNEDDYRKSAWAVSPKALFLENPLSEDLHMLRSSLVPSLLGCVAHNFNHGNKHLEIFEIAHVYEAGSERVACGIVLAGARRSTWVSEAQVYTLFDIKGVLEAMSDVLRVSATSFAPVEEGCFEPGTVCGWWREKRRIGVFGLVADSVKKAWSIKGKEDIFVAEVALEELAAAADFKKRFVSLTSIPTVVRDISLVADGGSSFERISQVIVDKVGGFLKKVSFAGRYQGKEIPAGKMGLHVSVEYGLADRTLTDQEINGIHQQVLDALVNELHVTLR